MLKQGGRSSALERAEAALSSRRGRGTSAAARSSTPRVISSPELSAELLSSQSGSYLPPPTAHAPKPKNDPAPEVGRPLSSLNAGTNRFLKKPAAIAAQNQPEERAASSSLRASQPAALSRVAQVEERFGKGVQKRSPSRVGKPAVQDAPKEHAVLAQPRRFVKSRPRGVLRGDGLLGRSDSLERSAQEEEEEEEEKLHSAALLSTASPSPVQAQTPPDLSPSPPSCLSSSAGSARVVVRSLEELFSLDEASEDTSGDFHIHLADINELEPASLQLEEDAGEKEGQVDILEEEPEEEEDYPSDFESVIQTESLSEPSRDSAQVPLSVYTQDSARLRSPPSSVHTQDSARLPSPPSSVHTQDSARLLSPPRTEHTEDSTWTPCPPRSERSYSKTSTSPTSEARSPEGPLSDTPPPRARIPSTKSKRGRTSHQPAHCVYSPSLQLLMESLRQQLALTSQFISSSREHHARVLQNLGPPNYTYTTLQDTQENIWKLRASGPRSKQLTGKR